MAALGLAAAGGCGGNAAATPAPTADEPPRAGAVRRAALTDVDTLLAAVRRVEAAAAALGPDPTAQARLRGALEAARLAYKRVEYLVEAYTPTAADQVNGPALPEVDEEEGDRPVRPPEGFQVLEALVYPEVDAAQAAEIRREAVVLRGTVARVRQLFAANVWNDGVVFEAARLEVARVVTLGLAGFDSPVAGRGPQEGAAALRGVRAGLRAYAPPRPARAVGSAYAAWRRVDSSLAVAADFLDTHHDVERLDRLAFITRHANPTARALVAFRDALGVAPAGALTIWRGGAATVFDAGAFEPGALASPFAEPEASPAAHAARVALGRRLFVEPALSRAGRTCASCHNPAHGFAESRARSAPIDPRAGVLLRNAPTLLNAALQGAQFADARAVYLEDQIADVIQNADEMHGSPDAAAATLRGRPTYRAAFATAFGVPHDTAAVTAGRVRAALAAYVRALTALDAPFDRYVRGDSTAMSVEARRGFDVFMGKGQCGTCHFAPLFNGTVPPNYAKAEIEVLGVPSAPVWRGARVDEDSGRMRVTAAGLHRHAFKTPTVRNAAVTAPYMHNGVYRTLEDVIEFYDRGGGAGIGIALPNQTLPPEPLRLSRGEKRDLAAFLRALTDTTPR